MILLRRQPFSRPRFPRVLKEAFSRVAQSLVLIGALGLSIVPMQAQEQLGPYMYPPLGKLPFIQGQVEQAKEGKVTFTVNEVYCGPRSLAGLPFYARYAKKESTIADDTSLQGPLHKGELVVGCIKKADDGKWYLYDLSGYHDYHYYSGSQLETPAVIAQIAAIKSTCHLEGTQLRAILARYARSPIELVSTWALGALGAMAEADCRASVSHLDTVIGGDPSRVSDDIEYFSHLWGEKRLTPHERMIVDRSLSTLRGTKWSKANQRVRRFEHLCKSLSRNKDFWYVQERVDQGGFSDEGRSRLSKLLVLNEKLSPSARADALKIYAASQKTPVQKRSATAFLLKILEKEPSLIVHRAGCMALVRDLQLDRLDLKKLRAIEGSRMEDAAVRHWINQGRKRMSSGGEK